LAGAPSRKAEIGPRRPIPVALDTNFLLLPIQRRIDIFEEIERLVEGRVEFVLLPQVMRELKRMAEEGSPKERREAEGALLLVSRCRLADAPSISGTVGADRALINYALEEGAIVATNDRALRRKLVEQGVRVIFLRNLSVLAITG